MINTKLFASDVLARVTKKNKDLRTTVEEKTAELYKITWIQKSPKMAQQSIGKFSRKCRKISFLSQKNLEISPKNPDLSRKLFENNRIICMKCEIPVVNLYGLEAPSN